MDSCMICIVDDDHSVLCAYSACPDAGSTALIRRNRSAGPSATGRVRRLLCAGRHRSLRSDRERSGRAIRRRAGFRISAAAIAGGAIAQSARALSPGRRGNWWVRRSRNPIRRCTGASHQRLGITRAAIGHSAGFCARQRLYLPLGGRNPRPCRRTVFSRRKPGRHGAVARAAALAG